MGNLRDLINNIENIEKSVNEDIELRDGFDFEFGEDLIIESSIVDMADDAILVELDETGLQLLAKNGITLTEVGEVIPFRGKHGINYDPKQMDMFGGASDASLPAYLKDNPYNPQDSDDLLLQKMQNWLGKHRLGLDKGAIPDFSLALLAAYKDKFNPKSVDTEMNEEDEAKELIQLAGMNWNDPKVKKHFDKPTISRIASGETEPVDRTDYDTPPDMRDPMQGKPGFDQRKANLIKQGILKALKEKMKMGASTDASASGTKVMGEGSYKQMMHDDAEKMTLEEFLKKYDPNGEHKEFVTDFYKEARDEVDEVDEAKYQGREVPLGKPMAGDVKKKKVYVRKPNGNVVKVEFGDKNMRIKKSNPKRRKSFRARHHCENPGPRWKARYWSCRAW